MTYVELLSPAKNVDCGIAAIKAGADAVYIGGTGFGARKQASNSIEDIKKLVDFAHIFGARVYVTVNTLIYEDELTAVQDLITTLHGINVDAVIIQDMAILEMDIPPIPLHASTQMHNISAEKILFLEKAGLQRVILPREFTKDNIAAIAKRTTIELEAFIHGALCVCYSGQCYMSHAIGGRSANRGECAQPCRKKYTLVDSSGKEIAKNMHLLSLKDLNLYDHLEELIKAGVTSFKIEGRLKDAAYVQNVVRAYSQKLDDLCRLHSLKRASKGTVEATFTPNLYKTFNRGYTTYFFTGKNDAIASPYTPKSIGEPIGKVTEVQKAYIKIESDKKLHNGDGICYLTNKNILEGTTVNKVEGNKIFLNDLKHIRRGDYIYRNNDVAFLKELASAKITRTLPIEMEITINADQVCLKAIAEEGISAETSIPGPFELAKTPETIQSTIEKQLSKLGDTPFRMEKLSILCDQAYFVPVKMLNELRRSVTTLLEEEIRLHHAIPYKPVERTNHPYPAKELDYTANIVNSLSETFYRRHGVEKIEYGLEETNDVSLKTLMTTKHCILKSLGLCTKETKPRYKSPLFVIDEHQKKYRLKVDCQKCEMTIVNAD